MRNKFLFLLPVFLLVHLFFLANLRFTAWPEMFSYPYLKNHNYLLYRDIVHPYTPVLTLALAYVYRIFDYNLATLEWFSWGIILFSTVCVWFLTRQVAKSTKAAVISTSLYVLLQPFLDGNMLWFDIAIVPPVLLGTLFLFRNKLLWSGIFFALAAFTKQTAGLFYLAALLFVARGRLARTSRRPLAEFLVGPLVFSVPLLVRLWQENALTGFWKWVVWYPATQWSKFPGYVQMNIGVADQKILLLLLALLVLACWWGKKGMNKDTSLLFALGGLSLVTIYPRFSFFHFQLALAFWSILCGLFLAKVTARIFVPTVTAFALIMIYLLHYPAIRVAWRKEARFAGAGDREFARNVAQVTKENETVFLQGAPSQLYVMARRLPPKPWADNYVWYLEIPGVQEEILSRWDQNPPLYIFWRIPTSGNWFDLGTYQPEKIVEYIKTNYNFERKVDSGIQIWKRKS
ncbi:MAG: hypothetical protein HYU80_02240 [Candidatus Blackburnbacteria bacterium]|nr:hypothetical protein [Candidatus Blackburnbacteria bacterium]